MKLFGGARWAVPVHELPLSVSLLLLATECVPSPFLQLSRTCLWLQTFLLVKHSSPFLLLYCLLQFGIFGVLAFALPPSFSHVSRAFPPCAQHFPAWRAGEQHSPWGGAVSMINQGSGQASTCS